MTTYQRIFIVGQPGAGKALLAQKVAELLGWKFIDADIGLEYRIGRTLNDLLGSGSTNFHHCQNELLSSLMLQDNIVVTTDASIVCHKENQKLLANEFVVFLKVSLPIQQERLSQTVSPLLLRTDTSLFLETLHEQRDSLFEQITSLTIDSDDSNLELHVRTVSECITSHKITTNPTLLDAKEKSFFHQQTHTLVTLTDQQAKCFKLLAQGKPSKEIAKMMHLSYRTVEGQLAKTMAQLGCSSSKELIALYHQRP